MASCDEASLDLTQYLTRLQEGGESRKEEKRNSEDIALLVQHIRDQYGTDRQRFETFFHGVPGHCINALL